MSRIRKTPKQTILWAGCDSCRLNDTHEEGDKVEREDEEDMVSSEEDDAGPFGDSNSDLPFGQDKYAEFEARSP